MKLFKHILVVVALMVAAVPCCHAEKHDMHGHGAETTEICGAHECACHACDETPCGDTFEMPQELTVSTVSTEAPPSHLQFYRSIETQLVVRQTPQTGGGILSAIQTVRLLI